MYRSRREVDKHVLDILSKVQNENEKNLKGFPIAKLYFQVKDYEMSKRYLAGYLSIRDSHASAHKLMGDILDGLGNKESALQSYKRSLELDANQKDLVLKICELYCDLPVDPDTARFWADRAEKSFLHHKIIFRLRERIANATDEPNFRELEDLITSELNSRPKDVTLHTKLLKLYTDSERVDEAYHYAAKVETKKTFPYNIDWYYCLADIFEAYQEEKPELSLQFSLEYLVVLDHLCTLLLAEPHALSDQDLIPTRHSRSISDSSAILHTFDRFLQKASLQGFSEDPSWMYVRSQMHGQLYLHLGTLLLKRAKEDRSSWKELSSYASALYLMAYTWKPGNLEQETWFCKMQTNKQFFNDIQRKGYLRLSYTGHVLWNLCSSKDDRTRWLQKVKQEVCVSSAQQKIFQRAFSGVPAPRQPSPKQAGLSFFLSDSSFVKFSLEFPTETSLYDYDTVSYKVYRNSLHHLVWFNIHWLHVKMSTKQTNFQVFEKLPFSTALLNNGAPESLCKLDVEAFLCATVFLAWEALEQKEHIKASRKNQTSRTMTLSLTADICEPLCTQEQANWWKAAYSLHFNENKDKLGEMRQTLRRGLETIRGIGTHGMDAALLAHLARHFSKQAEDLRLFLGEDTPSDDAFMLKERASHYWNLTLSALDKAQVGNNNQFYQMPSRSLAPGSQKNAPLFPSVHSEPSAQQAEMLSEEASYFLACRLMESNQLSEAAEAFSKLNSAEAAYNLANVLVKLSQQGDQDDSSRLSLMGRARDALYLTQDRISGNKRHPLGLHLREEIESLELKLIQSQSNGTHADKGSEENSLEDEDFEPEPMPSINGNDSYHSSIIRHNNNINSGVGNSSLRELLTMPASVTTQSHLNGSLLNDSMSRARLRPSPERLDAQIRALSYNQGEVLQLLLEEQKTLMESVKSIISELKENKILIEDLKKSIVDIQETKCKHPTQPQQPVSQSSGNQSTPRHVTQQIFNVHSPQQPDDGSEFASSRNIEPGPPYEYTVDGEESGFDYGSYLHDPRGYPMMMHYASHYPQPSPHMPPLAPQSFLSQRPPPPRTSYPPYGTALTFSEGQQLPQFNFRMPPPSSPGMPLPVLNPMDSRASMFAHMGPNQGAMMQPGPTQFWDNQMLQMSSSLPPPMASAQDMRWNNKGQNSAPHAFQIPLPAANVPSSQPPSILSTSQATFTTPETAPGLSSMKTTPILPEMQASQKPPESFQGFRTPGNESFNVNVSGSAMPVTPSSAQTGQASDNEDVSFDFKPAIPLPDEVDVHTGEENENVLYEERAKLFRFVDKEWKERGVGTVKILLDKNTNKVRLLMRRDQVLKVCANHHILPNMQLQLMKDSDRAWIWAAQDFAEETLRNEQFCIRFKNKDLALNFKTAFDSAVQKVKTGALVLGLPSPKVPESDTNVVKPFGNAFKLPPGSWSCSTCYVTNNENVFSCVACEAPNPKGGERKIPSTPSGFSFGGPPVAGSGFAALFQSKSFKCSKCKESNVGVEGELCSVCKNATGSIATGKPLTGGDKNVFGGFIPSLESGQKSDLGGFMFSSPPVIKSGTEPVKDATKVVPALSKPDRPTIAPVSKQKESAASGGKLSQSPFASFQFSSTPNALKSTASTQGIFPVTPVTTKEKEKEPAGLFGQMSSTNSLSFGNIAAEASPGFKPDPNFKGFPGSGQKLFQSPEISNAKDISGDGAEEFVPSVEFQPVVPLPALVDVKTGEEDEEKMFVERGKLFRFDSELKEWKERGIGDMKILKNTKTAICRILMRRDQVLKICANHRILPDMKLTQLPTSDKAWMWFVHDYSEGELKEEKLAIKFKSRDLALKFKKVFEECQEIPETSSPDIPKTTAFSTPFESFKLKTDSSLTAKPTETKSLAEMFKPGEGTWVCDSCYLSNKPGISNCIACETPRAKPIEKTPFPSFSFVATAAANSKSPLKNDSSKVSSLTANPTETKPLAEMFKPEEGTWVCDSCYLSNKPGTSNCAACETPRAKPATVVKSPLPKFSFVEAASASSPSKPFGFGTPIGNKDSNKTSPFSMPGFSFVSKTDSSATSINSPFKNIDFRSEKSNSPVQASSVFDSVKSKETSTSSNENTKPQYPGHMTPPPSSSEGCEFKFGSPQKFEFSFSGVRPKSPNKSLKSPGTPSDSAKDGTEDEAETSDGEIFFQPVIPLPPKVDVKTGEEEEEVVYCHRAKLFRLDQGEWKERGTGDVKLLKSLQTRKIRVLMRREQVLKVCLNHFLSVDLEFQEKGDRTWFWSAVDYADGVAQPEQLALRFKNHEIAEGFKNAVEDAKIFLRKQNSESKMSEFKQSEEAVRSSDKIITAKPSADSTTKSASVPLFGGTAANTTPPVSSGAFIFGNLGNKQTSSPNTPGSFIFGGSLGLGGTAAGSTMPSTNESAASKETGEDDKDVKLLFVEEATEAQKQKARSLQLPESFYLYEKKTPCPGCRGCIDKETPKTDTLKDNKNDLPKSAPSSEILQKQSAAVLKEDDLPLSASSESNRKSFGVVPEFSFAKLAAQKDSNGFAALAANSPNVFGFKQTGMSTGFAGAGAPVFGKPTSPSTPKDTGESSDEVAPSEDVHFDPLVPLPELVEVKTGEEDETAIFSQRAKLYRYDAKQWKERGTGEMKILKHNANCQFRLLLRRDQVLKIACNHLITTSLELNPMQNSNNSMVWSAMDFSEGVTTAEMFCIKFKNQELVQEFKKKVEECKAVLAKVEAKERSSGGEKVASPGRKSDQPEQISEREDADKREDEEKPPEWAKEGALAQGDEDLYYNASKEYEGLRRQEMGMAQYEESGVPEIESLAIGEHEDPDNLYHYEEVDEEEVEDEEEDDEEDEEIMFEKRITLQEARIGSNDFKVLGIGTLRVLYDDEVYGGRIQVSDDSTRLLCNHIVAIQTCLRVVDKEATWSVVDMALPDPTRRQFKAVFSSVNAAQEFQKAFDEAKQLAVSSEIVENEENYS